MIFNIQALRGLSSLLVVLVHLTGAGGMLAMPRTGQGGVDIFFVISGFLMVSINGTRRNGPMAFFAQRLARVAPFYWIMSITVYGVAVVRPSLLAATSTSPVDLVCSLAFVPFMKSNGLIQPTLFVGWTLNYEMFFYAVFAVGLMVKNPVAGTLTTVAILLSLVTVGFLSRSSIAIVRFYTDPVLLEFLAGMAIAVWIPPSVRFATLQSRVLLAVGAVSAVIAVVLGPLLTAWPAVLACGVPALVLVATAVALEQSGWRVRTPLLMRLGDASFAIYLTHPFVIGAIGFLHKHAETEPWSTAVLCVAGVVAAGDLAHRWIERPVSRWALRHVRGETARPFVGMGPLVGGGNPGE